MKYIKATSIFSKFTKPKIVLHLIFILFFLKNAHFIILTVGLHSSSFQKVFSKFTFHNMIINPVVYNDCSFELLLLRSRRYSTPMLYTEISTLYITKINMTVHFITFLKGYLVIVST